MNIPQITEAELEVMKVLWELGSVTSGPIVEKLCSSTDWKPKTIHTLISRLVSKEAVLAEKIDGKSYLYTAKVTEESYRADASSTFLEKVYNGSVSLMMANFVKKQKLTKEEIVQLKQLLEEES